MPLQIAVTPGSDLKLLARVSLDGSRWTRELDTIVDTGCAPALLWPLLPARADGLAIPSHHYYGFGVANGSDLGGWGAVGTVELNDGTSVASIAQAPMYFCAKLQSPLLGLALLFAQIDVEGPAGSDWSLDVLANPVSPMRLYPPQVPPPGVLRP